MKKILQALDGVKAKAEVNSSDMKKFLRVVSEGAPVAQQSPEQIAYNQLRAQIDSADSLRGGANTYTDVSPEVATSTAAMKQKLAQMAAALKAKGIDAEAEYNAPDASVPAAAPADLNKYNDQDTAPVSEQVGMSRLLSIISEGKGPLNRPTTAEAMTMQHYAEKKTITAPVLNVAEGAKPSMIGKYFKAVEQELKEAAERPNERARQLAERVIERIVPNADGSLPDPSINRLTGKPNPPAAEPTPSNLKPGGATVEYGGETYDVMVFGDKSIRPRIARSDKVVSAKVYTMGNKMFVLLDAPAQEGIAEDSDPCWDSHKMVGTKKKGGKTVPNCVPKEAVNPAQQAAIAIAKKKAGKK